MVLSIAIRSYHPPKLGILEGEHGFHEVDRTNLKDYTDTIHGSNRFHS